MCFVHTVPHWRTIRKRKVVPQNHYSNIGRSEIVLIRCKEQEPSKNPANKYLKQTSFDARISIHLQQTCAFKICDSQLATRKSPSLLFNLRGGLAPTYKLVHWTFPCSTHFFLSRSCPIFKTKTQSNNNPSSIAFVGYAVSYTIVEASFFSSTGRRISWFQLRKIYWDICV